MNEDDQAAEGSRQSALAGPSPSASVSDAESQARARAFALQAAVSLWSDKCENIALLDLRGLSPVTDFFVIATGTSSRQMRASGEHLKDVAESASMSLHRHNLRENDADWVLLDFVDVVVHIFDERARLFYDLEMLWGDAERITWRNEVDLPDRPGGA
ncbi:MAG: ribosome silencing factor [Planctomycetota bacterium]